MPIEEPKKPEDLLNQVDPAAGDKKEENEGQQGESEKKCPMCNGAKTYGTPQECPFCGGTGKYSVYAIKNF